jgi:glyoxylase-like metal-dependent hydrolase (beta-lactamase superfamily II)
MLISIHRLAALLVVCAGVLVLASPLAGQAPVDTVLKKEVLGNGIYLFRAPSDLDKWTATNVVVIVNDQDVTVFDSNTRPSTARMVIGEIRKLTDKPVGTLVNSHWHMDHWSGNDEYVKAFPGLQIIATTETRDYMKRMGPGFFADEIGGGLGRARAALDTAIRTGKQRDGTALTAAARRQQEQDIEETASFAREMGAVPRVLPNLVFRDTLIFWKGRREFRLVSATGDATGSAVLYLPAEQLLVTGDVLVSPESGDGPPPWTTNSYSIAPWLASLRSFEALDVKVIVPGQGPAFHDKAYLKLTADLFASIIAQVHAALERGVFSLEEVQAAVNVDSIGRKYPPGAAAVSAPFKRLVATLVRKVYQESLDGAGR